MALRLLVLGGSCVGTGASGLCNPRMSSMWVYATGCEGRHVGYLKRQPLASYLGTTRPYRGPRTGCSPFQRVAYRDALGACCAKACVLKRRRAATVVLRKRRRIGLQCALLRSQTICSTMLGSAWNAPRCTMPRIWAPPTARRVRPVPCSARGVARDQPVLAAT